MMNGKSQAIIEGNIILGTHVAGILIRDDANPRVNTNHIYSDNEVGVLVHTYGLGTISDNGIFPNRFSGIEIRS
jgi:parallel beta-helix repeat protein